MGVEIAFALCGFPPITASFLALAYAGGVWVGMKAHAQVFKKKDQYCSGLVSLRSFLVAKINMSPDSVNRQNGHTLF